MSVTQKDAVRSATTPRMVGGDNRSREVIDGHALVVGRRRQVAAARLPRHAPHLRHARAALGASGPAGAAAAARPLAIPGAHELASADAF